jgi:hypothetical protein
MMRRIFFFLCSLSLLMFGAAGLMAGILKARDPRQPSIATYHGDLLRSGTYIVRSLTQGRAKHLKLDTSFHPDIQGHIHAQPLYWNVPNSRQALLIVATEENDVYAIDARDAHTVWKRNLGPPVQRASLACGDIFPLGVTGTPVIDPKSETLYLDAAVTHHQQLHHKIFGLSLRDGSIRSGWPVDVGDALMGQTPAFAAETQNQRGALLLFAGTVYVPYGGFFDCSTYRGTVVGVSLNDPQKVTRWATRAIGGGVWAPGGIISDGSSLLVATGNTFDTEDWQDGEAVIRLSSDLRPSDSTKDFFTPTNWHRLDDDDADLGGVSPVMIDMPGAAEERRFLLTLGKDGNAYLLSRKHLGGIGGAAAVTHVSTHGIYGGAVAYRVGDSVFVAFPAGGVSCPGSKPQRGLAVLAVHPGHPPELAMTWCAHIEGLGAPIVTTSDGTRDPIVWVVGGEGDNQLHAFRGDTGENLLPEPQPKLKGLHRFQTLIATQDRLFVAADNTIYVFRF